MEKNTPFLLGKVCKGLEPVFYKIMGNMGICGAAGDDFKTAQGFY